MKNISEFEDAVNRAESAVTELAKNEIARLGQQNDEIYRVIAYIYAVHLAGEAAPDEYERFLTEKDVGACEKALTAAYRTVCAFISPEHRRQMKQRITHYAQCIEVLAIRDVDPADAFGWFDEMEEFDGKPLRGLAKALRVYRELPEVIARNEDRKQRFKKEKQEKVKAVARAAETKTLGVAKVPLYLGNGDERYVVIIGKTQANYELALLHIIDDSEVCNDLILKHIGA